MLILAPEVYLPLRLVGMHFHAAAEGLGAAGEMIDILEQESPKSGTVTDVPDLARTRIRFVNVTVQYADRDDPGLRDFDLELEPTGVTALVGDSGSGKSTALAVLERFIDVQSGRVIVGNADSSGQDLTDFDIAAWRANVAWVGQDSELVSGTVADNVRLANPSASDDEVREALRAVGLMDFVSTLALGIQTLVGEGGQIFSAGQTRRVALARAFCQPDAGLVLLDEPTAALDSETEAAVVRAIAELGRTRTVLLVAHRASLVSVANRVVDLTAVGA